MKAAKNERHSLTCLWPWIMLIPCKRFFSQPPFDEFFLSFDLLIRWFYKSCFHESWFIKTKVADCNEHHSLTCLWPWKMQIPCKRFFCSLHLTSFFSSDGFPNLVSRILTWNRNKNRLSTFRSAMLGMLPQFDNFFSVKWFII